MRKLATLIILSLASSFSVYAQNTNVSGTVTDSGGQAWVLGTYEFDFVPSPRFQGQYRQNGVPFNPVSITGNLDATASFSTIPVPDNNTITPSGTQWAITICPQATTKCFTSAPIVITGASETVTSSLVPPAISMSCGPTQKAYADVEVQCQQGGFYFGLIVNQIRLCTASTPPNTCNTWVGSAGTGGAGGVPIQTQVNSAGILAGTSCESFGNVSVGPENVDCDWHSKGPNPYVDVTRFGLRGLSGGNTPATSGVTGSITLGTNSLTISTNTCPAQFTGACFFTGDGIAIPGGGASVTLATPAAPTVSVKNARGPTGALDDVAGVAGTTPCSYKIAYVDFAGGITAASLAGSSAACANTLGANSVSITSEARATNVITTTTTAAHTMTTGTRVEMQTAIDTSFNGVFQVSGSADNTHYTVVEGLDTRNGATTATTGGTAVWYVANSVTWSAPPAGTFLVLIYGCRNCSPGSEVLLAASAPSFDASFPATQWDDFGATMSGSLAVPWWAPTSPPSVSQPDFLQTKITNVVGTTLTLGANATNTVTGGAVRYDSSPLILPNVANGQQLHFPTLIVSGVSAPSFIFNSPMDLSPFTVSLTSIGSVSINAWIRLGTGTRWYGDRFITKGDATSFTFEGHSQVLLNSPIGIYSDGAGGLDLRGLSFSDQSLNGTTLVYIDNGGLPSGLLQDVTFTGAGFMSIPVVCRGCSHWKIDNLVDVVGPSQVNGTTSTPSLWCNQCGLFKVNNFSFNRRGMLLTTTISASDDWDIGLGRIQGPITPWITVSGPPPGAAGVIAANLRIDFTQLDTTFYPSVDYLPSAGGTLLYLTNIGGYGPVGGYGFVSGNPLAAINWPISGAALGQNSNTTAFNYGLALDSVFAPNLNAGPATYAVQQLNSAVSTSNAFPIFVDSTGTGAPTCSVSAGGTWTTGTWTFKVTPVWQNGAAGEPSLASTPCVTTTGNQTITLTAPNFIGNPLGVDFYGNINGGSFSLIAKNGGNDCSTKPQITVSGGSLGALSGSGVCANVAMPSIPAGGPTMFMPGIAGIATPSLTIPPSGYDNFNRANGGIGTNWTAVSGTFTVSGNQVTTASTNATAFWSANSYGNDQFCQITFISGTNAGCAIRLVAANTGYVCFYSSTQSIIYQVNAGSFNAINTTAITRNPGDILRCEVRGINFIAYQNGVVVNIGTDSAFTGGAPGLYGTTATYDNWSGGNLHPIAQLDAEQDWTQPQHFTQPVTIGPTNPIAGTLPSGSINISGHYTSSGSAPTCTVSGAGTGATCTASTSAFSTDNSGVLQINTGTTPGTAGTVFILFNSSYSNVGICSANLINGTASWNARATLIGSSDTGLSNTNVNWTWDNNAVALAASTTNAVGVMYVCGGH